MYSGGEAAEQVVRIGLQGTEIALKLSGKGALHLAALLQAALSGKNKTAGKTRLVNMLRSDSELEVFNVAERDLAVFAKEAKRYGVLYCALRDKNAKDDGIVDVLVKKEDAAKLSRIIDKIKLSYADASLVVAQIEKERGGEDAPDKDVETKDADTVEQDEAAKQPARKEKPAPENPTTAKTERSNRSETTSRSKGTSGRDSSEPSRKSVRKEMDEMRQQKSRGEKTGKDRARDYEGGPAPRRRTPKDSEGRTK